LRLLRNIARRSVSHLIRVAAWLALSGLAIMAYSIISPRPLPVILAMSVGHVIGALAVTCYLLAIVLNASQKAPGASPAPAETTPSAPAVVEPPPGERKDSA